MAVLKLLQLRQLLGLLQEAQRIEGLQILQPLVIAWKTVAEAQAREGRSNGAVRGAAKGCSRARSGRCLLVLLLLLLLLKKGAERRKWGKLILLLLLLGLMVLLLLLLLRLSKPVVAGGRTLAESKIVQHIQYAGGLQARQQVAGVRVIRWRVRARKRTIGRAEQGRQRTVAAATAAGRSRVALLEASDGATVAGSVATTMVVLDVAVRRRLLLVLELRYATVPVVPRGAECQRWWRAVAWRRGAGGRGRAIETDVSSSKFQRFGGQPVRGADAAGSASQHQIAVEPKLVVSAHEPSAVAARHRTITASPAARAARLQQIREVRVGHRRLTAAAAAAHSAAGAATAGAAAASSAVAAAHGAPAQQAPGTQQVRRVQRRARDA